MAVRPRVLGLPRLPRLGIGEVERQRKLDRVTVVGLEGRVSVEVEQLPALVELLEVCLGDGIAGMVSLLGAGRVVRARPATFGSPAVLVDGPAAEHLEVLDSVRLCGVRLVDGLGQAHSLER